MIIMDLFFVFRHLLSYLSGRILVVFSVLFIIFSIHSLFMSTCSQLELLFVRSGLIKLNKTLPVSATLSSCPVDARRELS